MHASVKTLASCFAAAILCLSPAFAATPKIIGNGGVTVALKSNGSLWHWGGTGQVQTPALVNITGVTDVSGTYALRSDGTVWDVGGAPVIREKPVQVVGLANIKQIAAGAQHLLALAADGSLWVLGDNQYGELGNGSFAFGNFAPAKVTGLGPVKSVHASGFQSIVVLQDGTVWAWGDDRPATLLPGVAPDDCGGTRCYKTPRKVNGLSGIVKSLTGWPEHLALKSDGTVWVWGKFFWQQSYEISYAVPTQLPSPTGVADIAMGRGHYLMLTGAGAAWGFGFNFAGQLGTAASTAQATPVQVATAFSKAALFGYQDSTFLVRNDGQLFGLGDNTFGNLGDNSQLNRSAPIAVTGRDGVGFFNLLGANTVSAPTGLVISGPTSLIAGESARFAATASFQNGLTKVVNATFTSPDGTVTLSSDGRLVTSVAAGARNVPIQASYAESGASLSNQVSVTVASAANTTRPAQISAGGGAHTLALRRDGTVVAWGENRLQQLGDATKTNRSVPTQTVQMSDVVQVVASEAGSLVVRSDGSVHQWGYQAGTTPQQVFELGNVARLSTGSRTNSSFVIGRDGSLSEWRQFNGVTSIGLSGVTQLSTSSESTYAGSQVGHVLALRSDGTVYAWGQNNLGELGDGTRTAHAAPAVVPGLTGIVQVAAGGAFGAQRSFAVRNDGVLFAWGSRILGGLGDGYIFDCIDPLPTCPARLSPAPVAGLANVKAIAIATFYNVAVKNDGTVWTWGYDYYGSLGAGIDAQPPTQVPGLANIVAVEAGDGHVLAMRSDGTVFAWGRNDLGQLGDGTFVDRAKPVVVLRPEGVGSLDANDWFLDLDPTVTASIPAALRPAALAVARKSGDENALTLDATIKYKTADVGKGVKNYVFGLVPLAFFDQVRTAPGSATAKQLRARAKADQLVLAMLTPLGWTNAQGQLIAYSSGVANAAGGAANILKGINPALIPGSKFCVGYGESADAMLSSGALRDVLALQGATGDVAGTPCVVSGVYVDGPAASTSATPVTFNASVVGLDPSGSVQFRDGFGTLGTSIALVPANPAVSRASLTTSSLGMGVHSIGADFPGDGTNPALVTEYPLVHAVIPPQARTVVGVSGPVSSSAGSEVAFDVIVAGNNPTGTVQFKDGNANLGAPVTLVAGTAVVRISTLAIGSHTITAAYAGDGANAAATSLPLVHRVEEYIPTTVRLTAGANPSSVGTPVLLTATVTGTNPTGNVTFRDGPSPMATVALSGGVATLTVTAFASGIHKVTADYSGDGGNPAASSETLLQQVMVLVDPAYASVDSDGDGMTNGVEQAEGRNPFVRDNDIFASPRLFSMQQYRDFLSREGDAGGIAAWTAEIASGRMTRGAVIESFFNSPEFQGTISPVTRLYFAYFLRIPDYGGLTFWINAFKTGTALADISNAFAGSPEFTGRYGSLDNGAFVDLVYNNVLGRAPDPGGRAFWKGELDAGRLTRGQVMLGFSESPEYTAGSFNSVYVTMMYVGMLRRSPDQSGFNFWVDYKNKGNSGLALIDLFLGTTEYRGRFLP